MKKILLLTILSLSLTAAFGQSRVVEIKQLGTDYAATPPTVTIEVYWNIAPTPPRHRDTVWVFVDYRPVGSDGTLGAWAPATITAAVVDAGAGAVVAGSLNGRGFYLDGHAGPVPFSSTLTVTLSSDLTGTKFNWCAYATDYPPNATLGAAHYDLHGTPPFVVNGSTLTPGVRTFSGECIIALTDATGCPGLIPALPATPVLTASPDSICTGDTTTLTATSPDAAFYSFDDGATWIATNSATFSLTATTEYTIYIKNAAGCTATGAPATVTLVPPPVPVFINPPATYCADSTFILTASAGAGSSYCFTQTYTGASHNPYIAGNDIEAGVDCNFPAIDYCPPSPDSTFTVRMPESGSVTVCLRAWNAFGCPADTCITIGATPLPAIAIVAAHGASVQTIPLGQPLTTIKCATTDAHSASTAVTVTGLPAGMSYTWNAPNIEISGTASASATVGAHSYTVTAVGHCGTTTTQGVITIAGNFFSMVTKTLSNPSDSVQFSVNFTGAMYIDWGDGTSTYTTASGVWKKHFYTDGHTAHTVTAQAPAITTLTCVNNKLTALDVTKCSSLTNLQCHTNQLTVLDVTNNTALTNLNCNINQLTALDVTKNTAATYLNCNNNQLTTLDVTKNTALIQLNCMSNQLSLLDVSKNTLLTNLQCHNNQLTALDVSKNTAATYLHCSHNLLTSLGVTQNTALRYLNCYRNQLTTLDVSQNTALTYSNCGSNQLTTLDVSQNTALTYLNCGSNQLTTLDVTQNTALTELGCGNNQLSALDVTPHTELTKLVCSYNSLSTLDVSKNTKLTGLSCGSNPLFTLDVTPHTELTELVCSYNSLSTLDVSKNTKLTGLHCNNNQLSTLDVSKNTKLTELGCSSNLLSTLNVGTNAALTTLYCYGNNLAALSAAGNPALKELRVQSNLFDAAALDALFGTLHNNALDTKTVCIYNNPRSVGTGTTGCTPTIATGKGWTVNTTTTGDQAL